MMGLQDIVDCKDTRNCQEKVKKTSHFNPNELTPSIYIMRELCFFSLDQWEIRIHLLWGKCFNNPHHCDPHLNQTRLNGFLPLTIPGVLTFAQRKDSMIYWFSLLPSLPLIFSHLSTALWRPYLGWVILRKSRERGSWCPAFNFLWGDDGKAF